ncbi:MAG TPA: hypothetical protein VES19_15515 [Candidatus Limnocylindrales bacterium]|nr:hypothetical protein [Candidatus Limnocylindrales bacterium]
MMGAARTGIAANQPEVTPVDKKAKQPKKPKTATAKPKGSKTT